MSDWQSYHQQPPPPTSGAATASLVLGICGLVVCPFVCSVLALVFGYQAREQIDESGGQLGGRAPPGGGGAPARGGGGDRARLGRRRAVRARRRGLRPADRGRQQRERRQRRAHPVISARSAS